MIAIDREEGRMSRYLSPTGGMAGRVFFSTAAIVCAVLVAALLVASYSARRATREAERRGLEQAADLTAQLLAGRGRSLAGGTRVFVQGPSFRALVAERQHDDILDQALEATGQLGADWVFITDERGTLLAKSDEPGVQNVAMGSVQLVEGALEGRTTFGFGISRDTLLFQTVAVPIVVPGAAPVGVLVATKLVDRQMALDVRAATASDVVFYSLDARGGAHVVATSFDSASHAAAALPAAAKDAGAARVLPNDSVLAGPRAARTAVIGDAPFALQGASLTTAGGEVVGGFVVARPESATSAQLAGIRRSLLVAGLLGLILALAAAWSSARRITRPTRALAIAAAHALEGEYDAAARIANEVTMRAPAEEIKALGNALTAFLQELREKQALGALVERASYGDVSASESRESASDERGRLRSRSARSRTALAPQFTARSGTLTLPAGALAQGFVVADRYELDDVIGVGGTGIVYSATDRTLDEPIALKMLRPELLADNPRAREELKQELRLTRRVSHRNIVRTHDFGVSRGVPYLTMEYVEGTSLAAVLARRGALPSSVVLALAKQLMRALEAAHEQGVTHGDVKPANVLLANDGLLKVTDFGVATLVRRPNSPLSSARPTDDVPGPPRLAGAVIGTPEYMAPELLLGAAPDVTSDIYAAGMVLYESLTGATPFQGDTPRGFLAQKLDTPRETLIPPSAGPAATPRTLAAVIARMIAPEPADRPASATEVLELLARLG
jgi:serine/threonine-protein kinase